MTRFPWIIIVCGLALSACWIAIYEGGDNQFLTPPPEAIAEAFIKQLKTGRYSRAIPYLNHGLASQTNSDDLRNFTEMLKLRIGEITEVRGEEPKISGDLAAVWAVLRTQSKEVRLLMRLKREEGVWAVSELPRL